MRTRPGRRFAEGLILLALGLTLLWGGCREPLEGCLDVRAANYTAAADDNCCCEWPRMSFTVEHKVKDAFHSPVDTYYTVKGQAYRLLRMDFLLSDFKLHFKGSPPVRLLDSILLGTAPGPMTWIRDDIALLTRDISSFEAGRFIAMGKLDSVSFLLGLPESVSKGTPEDFPAGHPFRVTGSERWDNLQGYAMARAWILSLPSGDTLQWTLRESRRIVLPAERVIASGRPASLEMKIDYDAWFRDQDVTPLGMPDTSWPVQVASGFQ